MTKIWGGGGGGKRGGGGAGGKKKKKRGFNRQFLSLSGVFKKPSIGLKFQSVRVYLWQFLYLRTDSKFKFA